MQLKTILNRVQKFKCFVYGPIIWVEGAKGPAVEVELYPRRNSRAICSGCGHRRPGYDTLPIRRFEFIPMWGIRVFFLYSPRRVDCPGCGVRVERMPWVAGKHRLTEAYMALGIVEEARLTAAVLQHNFPDSEWYRDSWTLLERQGVLTAEELGAAMTAQLPGGPREETN